MENPYSQTAAPSTPEAQRLADYEAALGQNSGYYLKYFQQFDGGESKAGWHWPAFFVTSWWFLYRKLWLPGILNLLWPWIVLIGMAMTFAITRPPSANAFIVAGLLALVPTIVLPIFANAIYWHHVNRMVERLPKSVASVPDKRIARLERNGGTAIGPMLGIMLGSSVVLVIPVLAAISIPAYQDYTLRSQVTEGLNLASSLKAEVAEYYAEKKTWPDLSDLGHATPPSGKFVSEVTVKKGTVVITYGKEANGKLQEQKLAIRPGVNANGDIAWACGNHLLPVGYESAPGPYGSDVANKFLPMLCRE